MSNRPPCEDADHGHDSAAPNDHFPSSPSHGTLGENEDSRASVLSEPIAVATPLNNLEAERWKTFFASAPGSPLGVLPAGAKVGTFTIEEFVKQGGMGAVFRAEQRIRDDIVRPVALKVIRPDLAMRPTIKERFLDEIRALMRLSHSNIVTVHDAGEDPATGVLFMAMEWIDGETLDAFVDKNGPMTTRKAKKILEQMADALKVAAWREPAIVHRDIKPQNVMITRDFRAKLIDFGLARFQDSTVEFNCHTTITDQAAMILQQQRTDPKTLLGTLPYMPVEQFRNAHDVDCRTDIYALGCTIYYLLTGTDAFRGDSAFEILTNVLSGRFRPLKEAQRTDYDPHIDAILTRMMAVEQSRRYQTYEELIEDLDNLHGFTSSQPVGPTSKSEIEILGEHLVQADIVSKDCWAKTQTILKSSDGVDTVLDRLQSSTAVSTGLTAYQTQAIRAGKLEELDYGDYVLLDRLGAGFLGEVFLCRPKGKADRLVLRRLNATLFDPASGFPWLQDSVSRLLQLNPKAFCRILHVGDWRGQAYLVTSFVDGYSLQAVVDQYARPRNLSVRLLAKTFGRMAMALQKCHEAGLVHGDFRPSNVMITLKGDPVILEFGLVAAIDAAIAELEKSKGRTTNLGLQGPIGAPQYMAPELFEQEPPSIASDIYSFGATLYFATTLQAPFLGESGRETRQRHFSHDRPRAGALRPNLPRAFEDVIQGCLAVQPSRRFSSMMEIALWLRQFSDGR